MDRRGRSRILLVHSFPKLVRARLVKRYKRFLADVVLEDGREVTAHCPNPGRMSSIIPETQEIYLTDLSSTSNPKRKLDFRWELAKVEEHFVVVNTQLANKVAAKLLAEHRDLRERLKISEHSEIRSEVSLPKSEGKTTRFDFAYTDIQGREIFLEVKQASLRLEPPQGPPQAAFPDAVTSRGKRHLEDLTKLCLSGRPSCLLFIVGRNDVENLRAAREIDPAYAKAFEKAQRSGVKILACRLKATPQTLHFDGWLSIAQSEMSVSRT